jgi:hypothetical protein
MKTEIGDALKATGNVLVTQTNSEGRVIKQFTVPNLVVATGKNYIASKMTATTNSPASMTHMAIGTGTIAAAFNDTTLGTEVARVSLVSSVTADNTITYAAAFPAGTGTGNITEAGVFNASSDGIMLCRTSFSSVAKQLGDSITITWVVTVS